MNIEQFQIEGIGYSPNCGIVQDNSVSSSVEARYEPEGSRLHVDFS